MSSTATFWQRRRRQRCQVIPALAIPLGYTDGEERGDLLHGQQLVFNSILPRPASWRGHSSFASQSPPAAQLHTPTGRTDAYEERRDFFFSSPELNFCVDSYSVSVLPALAQWHVKDPDHSAKSAGGRLHLNTSTSFTQRSRSGLTNAAQATWEPIRESNSHETRQGMLGHCRASSLSHCGPIMA